MTFIGCALTAGLGSSVSLTPFALLLGLGSGFGYATYSIFAVFATRKYSPLTTIFYTFFISGITSIFLMAPGHLASIAATHFGALIPCVLELAAISTALPYIAYTMGLMRMEAGRAAVLVTVEPVVGTLLGIFAYHEATSPGRILGIVLVFAAVLLLSVKEDS